MESKHSIARRMTSLSHRHQKARQAGNYKLAEQLRHEHEAAQTELNRRAPTGVGTGAGRRQQFVDAHHLTKEQRAEREREMQQANADARRAAMQRKLQGL